MFQICAKYIIMKKLILIIWILFPLLMMSQKDNNYFTITGKIPNNPIFNQIDQLVLYSIKSDKNFVPIDSIQLSADKNFHWKIPFNAPLIYHLKAKNFAKVYMVIDKAETLTLNFSSTKGKGKLSIANSIGNDQLQWFLNKLEQLQIDYFEELKPQMEKAIEQKQEAKIEELQLEVARLFPLFVADIHKAVDTLGTSAAAFAALGHIDANKGRNIIESITEKFQSKVPHWTLSKILDQRLAAFKGLNIGALAPTFKLPSLEGDMIALSQFRGQYVFIDFWASWCLACRAENPKWEKIHQKYKGKEFSIIGIGVKDDLERWSKAIKKDELHYLQLSALNSTVPKRYLISSLPQNILLDKEGKIIAKNIKAKELEKRLENLLKR